MNEDELEQKMIAAYDKMMARVDGFIDLAEQKALPVLQNSIDRARLQAVELKEITQDEADKVGHYLRRDLHAAAIYLETSGEEFSKWFSFDLELIEARFLDTFTKVADQTHLELAQLEVQAKQATEYHTGEISSIGTLVCHACETALHFKKTSRIPPCPKCHKTLFVREVK